MRIRVTIPDEHLNEDVVEPILEAVTRVDEHMIRSGQSPTSHDLISAGARWQPEPPGDEYFDHGGTIASRGHGDCDDWAPLHTATLRLTGEDPGARTILVPSGPNTWHATTERSDGRLDDPSVAAGMPAPKKTVNGADTSMQVWVCDPHDGRIYTGSLLPTTGPLSLHCGPQLAVRRLDVEGVGHIYQARCDMPLGGSPLVMVRGCLGKKKGVLGGLPYAFSVTATNEHPMHALSEAIEGAVMCGDAAELVPNLDRYQLLATQMGLAGHAPGEVREAISDMIAHDVGMAEQHTGVPGHAHLAALQSQLVAKGVPVSGYNVYDVQGFNLGDVGKLASGIVHSVSKAVNTLGKVPWGDILHGIQAAISVIPGLGTAVSEIIATAETAVNAVEAAASGSPLKFAIQTAYTYALATVPGAAGLRLVLDPYVNRMLEMAVSKALVDSGEIQRMLDKVPDHPKFGKISPRSVLASLAHILIGHLGLKNTSGRPAAAAPMPAPMRAAYARPGPAFVKPRGIAHAAVHVDSVPRRGDYQSRHWACDPLPDGNWHCRWEAA